MIDNREIPNQVFPALRRFVPIIFQTEGMLAIYQRIISQKLFFHL